MSASNGMETVEISKETLNNAVAKVNKQEGDFFDNNLTRKKILCVYAYMIVKIRLNASLKEVIF